MKLCKIGVIALLLFGMVISLAGIVCADQVVPAVPETQGLVTGTIADVVGLAMETDAGVWTLTNNGGTMYILTATAGSTLANQADLHPNSPAEQLLLAKGGSISYADAIADIAQISVPESMLSETVPGETYTWQDILTVLKDLAHYSQNIAAGGIHTGTLNPGQVQYTTAYDANIVAQAGHTAFTKSMNLNTGNKVIGQSNINAQTGLTFIATADGGNVVGSENLMIDGAGNTTKASDRMLCPFSSQPVDIIPAYCNIVQAGSKYDLTVGSVTTNANDRFVGNDATNPVALNYAINVKPYGTSQGQIPAMGSAMAYIKAHIQEARNYNNVNVTYTPLTGGEPISYTIPGTSQKAEDLTYNEQSRAQGTITSFQKVIAYQSGKSLL